MTKAFLEFAFNGLSSPGKCDMRLAFHSLKMESVCVFLQPPLSVLMDAGTHPDVENSDHAGAFLCKFMCFKMTFT